MFVAHCNTTFLKPSLKKVAVVFLVAFFSVSAYGQKYYLAYEPKIPEHSYKMYYGSISDSEFLYGTSSSEGSSSYSQKIYLYRLSDHSSTQLIHIESPASKHTDGTSIIEFVKAKNRTYIISSGNLIITDGTPSGTKLLKSFGTRNCCGYSSDYSRISPLFIDKDNLYFIYQDSITDKYPNIQVPNSMSIWKSDGTQLGTRKISRSISEGYRSTFGFIGKAFVNYSFDPNNLFYFSKGGLWKSNQNNKPFIALDDEFTKSFFESPIISTTRGNFMCGLNYDKTGKALWRFSNSGKFEIIANGCDAIATTFNNRVFYTAGSQLWETDGTSLGERKLLNYRSFPFEHGISSCKMSNNLYLSFRKHDSGKSQFIKIDNNGIIEDLSTIATPHLGNFSRFNCIKDKVFFSTYLGSRYQPNYLTFNLKNKKIGKVLNQTPKQLKDSNKSYILVEPPYIDDRRRGRPFLLSETTPHKPNLGALFLLLDED